MPREAEVEKTDPECGLCPRCDRVLGVCHGGKLSKTGLVTDPFYGGVHRISQAVQ